MAKKKEKVIKANEKGQLFGEDVFMENMTFYERKNIADETKRYRIIDGINKNLFRHIPSGYDGLKPVARRALLTMYEDSTNGKKMIKVSTWAGNTMSKYHPHGDASIEEVIGKMGQIWNNNVMYIEAEGNYGTEQGDPPAAGRYIKCRLSKFAYKCFFEDYKYASLDRRTTYTGEGTEPEYLPAKYPVALVNPQFSSIGYGTAANIAPYNFGEVMEATIKLLKDPSSKIKLIPDFPNGCEVVADERLEQIDKNHGRGSVTVRSTIEIDHEKNIIKIKSLPLKIGTKSVISTISKLIIDKKIEGIKDIYDQTNKINGVQILIILNKDVDPEKMVQDLIRRNIGLQKSFAVQIRYIEGYEEADYSPKEYLLNWIDFRREIVQGLYNRKYVLLKQEEHMNDIKIFVFGKDNIEKTLKIVKNSKNDSEGIEKMMSTYKDINMTSLQAKTICNMRVREFNKESYQKFLERKEELKKEIAEAEKIIADSSLIDQTIIKELEEGIELFATPRKSKIIYEKSAMKKVSDKMVVIAVSKDGFIKKIDANKYNTIGNLGGTSSKEVIIVKLRNNKSVMMFDTTGKVSKIPVNGIPEMTPDDNGVEVERYFKVKGRVVAVMEEITDKEILENLYIVFTSKRGFCKKTKYSEFKTMRDIKVAMNIDDGDELVSTLVEYIGGDKSDDIILYTTKGNGIRLQSEDIRTAGASTKGKLMMQLSPDEEVAGANRVQDSKRYLFYMTSTGRGKITEGKNFPTMSRKDAPVALITLSATEKLVSVVSVSGKDRVLVYKKNEEPVEITVKDLQPSMRIAKGEKLVKVSKGDIVISVKVIK